MASLPRRPTALKLLQGSVNPQHFNPNEPTPELGVPVRPRHLKGIAKKQWDAVLGHLLKTRVLSVQDGSMLAVYCQLWQAVVLAGKEQRLPSMQVLLHFRQYSSEFGLSPASRARTHAAPATKENNEWSDLQQKSQRVS